MALPLRALRQSVRSKGHRIRPGVLHRDQQPLIFRQLQLHADPPPVLRQLLTGVDGVFQGVGQDDADIRLLKGERFRNPELRLHGAAFVAGLDDIGRQHRVDGGVGAADRLRQLLQSAAEGTDIVQRSPIVPLLEQALHGGQMVTHVVAVNAPHLHLLAQGVVILPLDLHQTGVFIHPHLPPEGVENGNVGQGHQRQHQQQKQKAPPAGHRIIHGNGHHDEHQIVKQSNEGKQPPAPFQLPLKLLIGAAQLFPDKPLRQGEEDQAASKHHRILASHQPVQQARHLDQPNAHGIRQAKEEEEPPIPVLGNPEKQGHAGQ